MTAAATWRAPVISWTKLRGRRLGLRANRRPAPTPSRRRCWVLMLPDSLRQELDERSQQSGREPQRVRAPRGSGAHRRRPMALRSRLTGPCPGWKHSAKLIRPRRAATRPLLPCMDPVRQETGDKQPGTAAPVGPSGQILTVNIGATASPAGGSRGATHGRPCRRHAHSAAWWWLCV